MSDLTSETPSDATTSTEPDEQAEAAEQDSTEPEEAGGGAEGAEKAPPSRTLVRSLVVLCAVFFVATVVMAILAAQQHNELQRARDTRADVEQVASRFTSALLTYDYRDLDKTKRAVLALSTGKFRTDYDQNFSGLGALFTSTKGQSTATIKDVFVSGIQDNTATAIAVFDERTQGTGGQRLNVDLYVRLSLVKSGGAWRVDDVTNLNFPVQTPSQSTPSSTPPK